MPNHLSNEFVILPAIDLRDGKVVRLEQGDPNRQTTFSDDPVFWAKKWRDLGANWLHIINLSGAFGEDETSNLHALEQIRAVGLKVEFGGGVRALEKIDLLNALGVDRIFLGTIAILQPELVKTAIRLHGAEKIAGDIGAKNGKVMIKGWQESMPISVNQAGQDLYNAGVRWCVLTDVDRDGVGQGVNLESAIELQKNTGLQVVASGGVSRLDDVIKAKQAGVAGIIIGRALYNGQINLQDCFEI
jgi:phosphoribosylformimino-5-aminoimidazole carboxamide ribotide isomerase